VAISCVRPGLLLGEGQGIEELRKKLGKSYFGRVKKIDKTKKQPDLAVEDQRVTNLGRRRPILANRLRLRLKTVECRIEGIKTSDRKGNGSRDVQGLRVQSCRSV